MNICPSKQKEKIVLIDTFSIQTDSNKIFNYAVLSKKMENYLATVACKEEIFNKIYENKLQGKIACFVFEKPASVFSDEASLTFLTKDKLEIRDKDILAFSMIMDTNIQSFLTFSM